MGLVDSTPAIHAITNIPLVMPYLRDRSSLTNC